MSVLINCGAVCRVCALHSVQQHHQVSLASDDIQSIAGCVLIMVCTMSELVCAGCGSLGRNVDAGFK
jgi:hypothetical protein